MTILAPRRRDRRETLRTLVPRIVAAEAASLPENASGAEVTDVLVTSTGMAVATLARPGAPPCLVIKLPQTAAAALGQARESAILHRLLGDERLGTWVERLPRPVAEGALDGRPYRIDRALRGRPVPEHVRDRAARRRALEDAAAAIHDLHRATAEEVTVDAATVERWVDAPAEALLRRRARVAPFARRFRHLRDELHTALLGRTFATAWIHGDFWLGNVLGEPGGLEPAGIVDWDAAAPRELPHHDLHHLLLSARILHRRGELGTIVARRLGGAGWTEHEQRLLDRYGVGRDAAPEERHALLLHWLRHAAVHAEQSPARPGPRYRAWELRNVDRVLAAL